MQQAVAIGFLLGLTATLGVVLAFANAKWKVFEDPRVDDVQDMLPNSNCGACGLPGCRVFAEKVVAGAIQPSGCTVGGPETASAVADYLGVEAGTAVKRVARLHCAGGSNVAIQMAQYEGHQSCRSAAAVAGGGKGCRYGCLGFGDCEVVCDFDAIKMSPTGLPVVDTVKCTACGDCVDICPKDLFDLVPLDQRLIVQCKSQLEGDEMLELCKVACTGCARCVADAPQGLLKMQKNLPVMNPELVHLETAEAVRRCPTGAIRWVEGDQFQGEFDDVVSQSQR